eukprot:755977-Hanusia_phi.AAC.1
MELLLTHRTEATRRPERGRGLQRHGELITKGSVELLGEESREVKGARREVTAMHLIVLTLKQGANLSFLTNTPSLPWNSVVSKFKGPEHAAIEPAIDPSYILPAVFSGGSSSAGPVGLLWSLARGTGPTWPGCTGHTGASAAKYTRALNSEASVGLLRGWALEMEIRDTVSAGRACGAATALRV